METKWIDVAHLYTGNCDVFIDKSCHWSVSQLGIHKGDTKMLIPSVLTEIYCGNIHTRPILRKLPDMKEDEVKELNLADVQIGLLKFADRIRMFMTADQLHSMLKMGFDLYSLISSGQAIDRTTLPSLTNQ